MPEKTRTAQSGYESSVVLVVKTALAPGHPPNFHAPENSEVGLRARDSRQVFRLDSPAELPHETPGPVNLHHLNRAKGFTPDRQNALP